MKPSLDLIRAMLRTQGVADVVRALRAGHYEVSAWTVRNELTRLRKAEPEIAARRHRGSAGADASRAIGRTGPVDPDADARNGSMKLLRRQLEVGQHHITDPEPFNEVLALAWAE